MSVGLALEGVKKAYNKGSQVKTMVAWNLLVKQQETMGRNKLIVFITMRSNFINYSYMIGVGVEL